MDTQTRKRKARALAMQILYLWDTQGQNDAELARQVTHDASDDPIVRQWAGDMADGAWEQRQVADRWVERLAPQWPTHRQPPVDRNLLRLSVWELTNTDTPPNVVIDEAIELAKEYSTQQSPAFVNAILDGILKEHRALVGDGGTKTEGTPENPAGPGSIQAP